MDNAEGCKNLIEDCNHPDWFQWFPREVQKPLFRKIIVDGRSCLEIDSGGKANTYGKWCYISKQISGGQAYQFRVEYKAREVISETVSVNVILTWQNPDGKDIARDYADIRDIAMDGWTVLKRDFEAPEQAAMVKIELVLRWPGNGSVIWRNPSLNKVEKKPQRIVRIATTYINPKLHTEKTKEEVLQRIGYVVDEAGKQNADVILLSETINDRRLPIPLEEKCETLSGPCVRFLSGKARDYNCYIIFSIHEEKDGYFYNTAILMDRKGEISGVYRKTHLAMSEGEAGIVPGNEFPVFHTDFGTIGILICWDHYFPEPARILRLKGAEIVFVSTAGDAPIQSLARAVDNGMYVVVSGVDRKKSSPMYPSRIIDPLGNVIAEVKEEDLGVCVCDIDLNHKFYSYWLSVGDAWGENRSIFVNERRPDLYNGIVTERP